VQGCFTEPEEVSAAIDAGATGALIDLGLVVSGPGFAKRVAQLFFCKNEN
jgi:hypothetical protein